MESNQIENYVIIGVMVLSVPSFIKWKQITIVHQVIYRKGKVFMVYDIWWFRVNNRFTDVVFAWHGWSYLYSTELAKKKKKKRFMTFTNTD